VQGRQKIIKMEKS